MTDKYRYLMIFEVVIYIMYIYTCRGTVELLGSILLKTDAKTQERALTYTCCQAYIVYTLYIYIVYIYMCGVAVKLFDKQSLGRGFEPHFDSVNTANTGGRGGSQIECLPRP